MLKCMKWLLLLELKRRDEILARKATGKISILSLICVVIFNRKFSNFSKATK